MIAEEIGLNEHLEANGIDAGRDRSRRIHHPAAPRAAEPHHRAGGPSHQGPGRGRLPPRAHASRRRPRPRPSRTTCCAEARAMLRERFLAADVGITGANFLVAETGTVDHRHQRGQRRPDADPAARCTSCSPRIEKVVPTLEDAAHDPARAGALGDRPGDLGLHDASRPARAAPGDPDGPERVPRRAPRQRPLGDARHRVPGHAALHPLRRLHEPLPGLSARSAATPMAGSIPARWARC